MKNSKQIKEEQISPVNFRARSETKKKKPKGKLFKTLSISLFILLLLLFGAIVFLGGRIQVTTQPDFDRIHLKGKLPLIKYKDAWLALPGTYTLKAEKKGYQPLAQDLVVQRQKNQHFDFEFKLLPGFLKLNVNPAEEVEVSLNGSEGVILTDEPLEIDAGEISLTLTKKDYLSFTTNLVIRGKGEVQELAVTLDPAWADLSFSSIPSSALYVNGKQVGETALSLELFEGGYEIEFRKVGFESFTTNLVVSPGQQISVEDIRLEKKRGVVHINSVPAGANVQIDGKYRGATPLSIEISSEQKHLLELFKPGFENLSMDLNLKPGETQEVASVLSALLTEINIESKPSGARVVKDGEILGETPLRISVAATSQVIRVEKEGYEAQDKTILPRPGPIQTFKFILKDQVVAEKEKVEAALQTFGGMRMVAIPVGSFKMGSSRREQGRKSNETQVQVKFNRPFAIAAKEVTNKEYLLFDKEHNSGTFRGASLNRDAQPVVNLTWESAVQYCNWLSQEEGFEPAYQEVEEGWSLKRPVTIGYRLPFEAEWEYAARYRGGNAEQKYPWGDNLPPQHANLADKHAEKYLDRVFASYSDAVPVAGSVGKFQPNDLGLFDLAGNVSEWCSDYYHIYPSRSPISLEDPLGPETGRHHVIRGSSWMDASISKFRCSYRSYGEEVAKDVGFRVARYIE